MNKHYICLISAFIIVNCVFVSSCEQVDKIKQTASEKIGNTDIKKEIEGIYQKVKETGASVPNDAIEWASEDIKKIGDWDYRVVPLVGDTSEKIESEMNEFGAKRWEIFWVENTDDLKIIYMKRPSRSYLKNIPLRDVLRIIPAEQGE